LTRTLRPVNAIGSLGETRARACPVCGSTDDGDIHAPERLDLASLDQYAFASRKRPEHMRLRLVRCPVCDLVYASPVPAPEALARAYEAAAFDSGVEARFAARTYIEALRPILNALPDRVGALDIGTGDGAFLGELLDAGFSSVSGVEPSTAPVASADPRVAGLIEHDVFHPGVRPATSLSLVTCFQTIEHVSDPAGLVRDAVSLLKPEGVFAIVCHDRRAPLNRLLGLRSPIIDIEHQQLFSRASVHRLLSSAGLVGLHQRPISNRYPMRYWVRLLPLPRRPSTLIDRALVRAGLADRPVNVRVGNLLAWGRRASDTGRAVSREESG